MQSIALQLHWSLVIYDPRFNESEYLRGNFAKVEREVPKIFQNFPKKFPIFSLIQIFFAEIVVGLILFGETRSNN